MNIYGISRDKHMIIADLAIYPFFGILQNLDSEQVMEEQPTSADKSESDVSTDQFNELTDADKPESDVSTDQFNELTDAELPKEMNYQPNRKRVSYTSYNISLSPPP